MVVAAMAMIVGAPAGALAAGEGSTESPGGPAEAPAAPEDTSPGATAPPSTGWVPQGPGTEASGGGATGVRHGSSLGSGGSSSQSGSAGEAQSGSTGEEPSSSTGSGTYHGEPQAPTASTSGEAASPPRARHTTVPAPPPVSTHKPTGIAALGAATRLTAPESPRSVDVSSAPPVAAAPLTYTGDQATSGPNALQLLALVGIGLTLVYAGGRLGLHLWRRRRQQEVFSRQDQEWEAALRQIQRTRTSQGPRSGQPRRDKAAAPARTRAGTGTGSRLSAGPRAS